MQERDPQSAIPGQYIVVLNDEEDADKVAKEHKDNEGAGVERVYKRALKGYAAKLSGPQLEKIRSDERVLFVSENRELYADAQSVPTGIERIDSEPSPNKTNKGSGVGVAVLDTGIDLDHPDLVANVNDGTDCIQPGTTADDDHGHGTHVAGTVAAQNNDRGVVGVAPEATLHAVKVLNSTGSGTTAQVICGIDWVTANAHSLGIKVANMSLSGPGSDDNNCGNTNSDAYHKAICRSAKPDPDPTKNYPGVTYAVAAGNNGSDLATRVPAAYNEVATVTALADFDGEPGGKYTTGTKCRSDVDDTAADFSNYAKPDSNDRDHTIAAPGVCILSTYTKKDQESGAYVSVYELLSGTSMASPHIAGTAALYLANDSDATSTEVISALQEDAELKSDPSANTYYGFTDDPNKSSNSTTRYYDYLEWPGGYLGNTNPLRVGVVSPSKDATEVRLRGTKVEATFSRDIEQSTVTTDTFTLTKQDSSTGSTIPVGAKISFDDTNNKKAILEPDSSLEADTTYTATIKSGSSGAKDTTQGTLAADKVWSFTTTDDTTPPTVESVNDSPSKDANAPGTRLDTDITATFSDTLDESTITTNTFTLEDANGSSVPAALSYDASTKKATLNPSSNLKANTTYKATLKGGSQGIQDEVGNPLAEDYNWSFTTANDSTRPTVIQNSPTGWETVPMTTNVTVTFSEAIDPNKLTRDTFMLVRGVNEPTPTTKLTSGTTVALSSDGKTATLNPYGPSDSPNLFRCSKYTAKVTSGVTDGAGNPAVEKVWQFKTRGC